jgi:tRNA-splicing ligase RtcB
MKVFKTHKGLVKAWIDGVPIEESALEQAKNIADSPHVFKHVALMPDAHLGKGACIGAVVATVGAAYPSVTGVDIGCGMMACPTLLSKDALTDVDLSELRAQIEASIPTGRSHNGGAGDCGAWPRGRLPSRIRAVWDAELEETFQDIIVEYPDAVPYNDANHLGTLGTGNHFIEMCTDEEGHIWLMIHSGSRGPGNKFGAFFIGLAQRKCKQWASALVHPDLAFLPQGEPEFDHYMKAAEWAQLFAARNRELMMDSLFMLLEEFFGTDVLAEDAQDINCHHNYIARENHYGKNVLVTRKGAIRARTTDFGIIPGSMGSRSYIIKGKGAVDSFCSASHGAGRTMSRGQAKRTISIEDHAKALEGVECDKSADTLDEGVAAYKDIGAVLEAEKDLIEVKAVLKQFLCVKGANDSTKVGKRK